MGATDMDLVPGSSIICKFPGEHSAIAHRKLSKAPAPLEAAAASLSDGVAAFRDAPGLKCEELEVLRSEILFSESLEEEQEFQYEEQEFQSEDMPLEEDQSEDRPL